MRNDWPIPVPPPICTHTDGSTVKRQLAKQIRADPDAYNMILHVGDFAYDMVRVVFNVDGLCG